MNLPIYRWELAGVPSWDLHGCATRPRAFPAVTPNRIYVPITHNLEAYRLTYGYTYTLIVKPLYYFPVIWKDLVNNWRNIKSVQSERTYCDIYYKEICL